MKRLAACKTPVAGYERIGYCPLQLFMAQDHTHGRPMGGILKFF